LIKNFLLFRYANDYLNLVSQNVFVGGESYLDANGYCLIKVVVAVTVGVAIAIFPNKTMIKFATLIVSSFDE
jgi:hypothetical protein